MRDGAPDCGPFAVGTLTIEGDGDLARVCDEAERLLIDGGIQIFQRGGMLVRVISEPSSRGGIERDAGSPRIVALDDLSLADLITRHVEVYRRNRKTGDLVRVDCPRNIAQTLLARREWAFPYLEAVVEHPVLLASGEVLWESGYHAASGLLLVLPEYSFQSPYDSPSRDDAIEALEKMRRLLEGFPFVADIDESVALAFLLTPFVRPVLPTAPAFGVDAHSAGSGKSTLVRVASVMSAGREPAFLTYGDDPNELRKLLFAALLEGDQQIAIDNIDGPVADAVLAVILTAPMFRGRVLGQSVNASVPTKAVISLNGNNLQIIGDLTRRVLVGRLDPDCERPAERTFDFNPIEEVRDLRSDYVLATLTIMSAYLCCGDRVKVRPFGSFEEWSRLVREPLVWLGMADPVDSIRVLEAIDPEREQLRAMLSAVHATFEQKSFKAAELVQAAQSKRQSDLMSGPAPSDGEREQLAEALHAVCERNSELNARALGKWLLRMNGRIENGLRFVRFAQAAAAATWKVERHE